MTAKNGGSGEPASALGGATQDVALTRPLRDDLGAVCIATQTAGRTTCFSSLPRSLPRPPRGYSVRGAESDGARLRRTDEMARDADIEHELWSELVARTDLAAP